MNTDQLAFHRRNLGASFQYITRTQEQCSFICPACNIAHWSLHMQYVYFCRTKMGTAYVAPTLSSYALTVWPCCCQMRFNTPCATPARSFLLRNLVYGKQRPVPKLQTKFSSGRKSRFIVPCTNKTITLNSMVVGCHPYSIETLNSFNHPKKEPWTRKAGSQRTTNSCFWNLDLFKFCRLCTSRFASLTQKGKDDFTPTIHSPKKRTAPLETSKLFER